jgi:hypothetical protein
MPFANNPGVFQLSNANPSLFINNVAPTNYTQLPLGYKLLDDGVQQLNASGVDVMCDYQGKFRISQAVVKYTQYKFYGNDLIYVQIPTGQYHIVAPCTVSSDVVRAPTSQVLNLSGGVGSHSADNPLWGRAGSIENV